MRILSRLQRETYLSSADPANRGALLALQERMFRYYSDRAYHQEWIKGINADWRPGSHDVQLAMCRRIPPRSRVLEVGCGDGSGAPEIASRVPDIEYVGADLNTEVMCRREPFQFVRGQADELPFPDGVFDVVLSMYTIEHLVFPARYLDEAWRVLRPEGRLLTIAPDFLMNPMASERVGLSYGSGRTKLSRGKVLDAMLTAYDSRLRLRRHRLRRRSELDRGLCPFPVLTTPRCLRLSGFTPDCDAIYPSCPEEVLNHLRPKPSFGGSELFYRDEGTFGLMVLKQSCNGRPNLEQDPAR